MVFGSCIYQLVRLARERRVGGVCESAFQRGLHVPCHIPHSGCMYTHTWYTAVMVPLLLCRYAASQPTNNTAAQPALEEKPLMVISGVVLVLLYILLICAYHTAAVIPRI